MVFTLVMNEYNDFSVILRDVHIQGTPNALMPGHISNYIL